jgi:1,4-alpha-glucan branching enzyme
MTAQDHGGGACESIQDPASAGHSASQELVAAIVGAECGDPFSVLGPHQLAPNLWEIRVLIPGARGVLVIANDGIVLAQMRRAHEVGFFVAALRRQDRPAYRLRIDWGGTDETRFDPYAFGEVLSTDDLAKVRSLEEDVRSRNFGAQQTALDGISGFSFAVWAPNARRVSVIGDFNRWDGRCHPMRLRHDAGIWELFVPELHHGIRYKFEIKTSAGDIAFKADPIAFAAERPPATASVLHGRPQFSWNDAEWQAARGHLEPRRAPISIYECHLGSWMRLPEENNRYLGYDEIAERLVPYVRDLGFTHIELLPIAEHPFDGSWGYQPVSIYAPTSRFGPPEAFARFIDKAHGAGLGVVLDWVPGHFPNDPHGLANFDGTHLYEHADPRQGFHRDWGTCIYNYGREEVASFLIENARFWVERYHLDGLRVDAVASMLYLDYSRRPGEWIPNRFGGNENLEAIAFLRHMNETVYGLKRGVVTVAEESTAWPGVSHPTYTGGLGFGFKWNMGWMHDTLRYISHDPIYRRHHHNDMTFGLLYAFSENFILPISHDEVVHGKRSLIGRMPGDRWQRFANLRAYLGFMWGHPGKKLLFMGGEFGQEREWNHDVGLDWHLTQDSHHRGVQMLVRDLNRTYQSVPALHERDCEASGFQWLVSDDRDNSVVAWARRAADERRIAIIVSNFTPVPRIGYRFGVPSSGLYREVVNTDAAVYGGSNLGNAGGVHAEPQSSHNQPFSVSLVLPPLATLILEHTES